MIMESSDALDSDSDNDVDREGHAAVIHDDKAGDIAYRQTVKSSSNYFPGSGGEAA